MNMNFEGEKSSALQVDLDHNHQANKTLTRDRIRPHLRLLPVLRTTPGWGRSTEGLVYPPPLPAGRSFEETQPSKRQARLVGLMVNLALLPRAGISPLRLMVSLQQSWEARTEVMAILVLVRYISSIEAVMFCLSHVNQYCYIAPWT